jgi:hypothetical protein
VHTPAFLRFVLALVPAFAADIRIEGVAGRDGVAKPTLTITDAEFGQFPRAKVAARDRDGKAHTYEGVLIAELLKRAGQPFGEELRGSLLSRYVVFTARDAYRVVFALPELDPAFTDHQVILADRIDGLALPERDGPFRVVASGDKRQARWIRMVERIQISNSAETLR